MTARLSFVCILAFVGTGRAADPPLTDVGRTGKFEQLVLPGSELEVKPLDDRKGTVVLRIVAVNKHGTAYRYDLEYYGLEPGRYDLKDWLRRKDGSPTTELPSIPIAVKAVLPPGHVLPHDPTTGGAPNIGGYRKLLILAAAVWALVMLAIVFLGWGKKHADMVAGARPATLADRLRPLVERGSTGQLSPIERADLERTLMAFWRKRLRLGGAKPAVAISVLKAHADAGPLLRQLELWLHKPGPSAGVDVAALLRPYQNLPADALDDPAETPVATP